MGAVLVLQPEVLETCSSTAVPWLLHILYLNNIRDSYLCISKTCFLQAIKIYCLFGILSSC